LRAFNSGQIPLISDFEKSLERSKGQLLESGFRVTTELKLGSAAQMILQHAEEKMPDLIVMGAKGLRSTVSILPGGLAPQVIEYATCPVLIVRAPGRGFHKVLLATDGSPMSHSTARYLGKFPLPEHVEVHLLHVMPPIQIPVLMEPQYGTWHTIYAAYPTQEEEEVVRERERKKGQAILDRTCTVLHRYGIDPIPRLLRGDAATEIMEYVQANQIDLIVAGSHGYGNLRSIWVGSVSRKLVHYSDCSVLIVRGPRKE
jgi:nucleotide-binding universal stress UspA family protein